MTINSGVLDALLGWLGEASIVLGLVVLLVLLVRRVARDRLGAGWTYALWLAVPAALAAALAPNGVVAPPFDLPFGSPGREEVVLDPGLILVSDRPAGPALAEIMSGAALAVWLVGLVGFLVAHLVAQWRFERAVVRAAREPGDGERAELAAAAADTSLLAERDFRFTDRVASPVACGLLRPIVLLPEAFLTRYSRDERRVMVVHEGEHVSAQHLAHRVAATILRSVFWFHPLAWWGERAFIADQELACDQAALGRDASIRPRTYAQALLKTAGRIDDATPRVPAASVPLITIRHLKERTAMLARHASLANTRAAGLATLGVVGAMSVLAGLSGCVGAGAQEEMMSTPDGPAITEQIGALAQAEQDVVRRRRELERAAQEAEAAGEDAAALEDQRRALAQAQEALEVQRRELEMRLQELDAASAQRVYVLREVRSRQDAESRRALAQAEESVAARRADLAEAEAAGESEASLEEARRDVAEAERELEARAQELGLNIARRELVPVWIDQPFAVRDRDVELEQLRAELEAAEAARSAGEGSAEDLERLRRRLAEAESERAVHLGLAPAAPVKTDRMVVYDRIERDLGPDDVRREIAMTEERLARLRHVLEDMESARGGDETGGDEPERERVILQAPPEIFVDPEN